MEYRNLGNTKLKVSAICLGTMTFGEQNSEEEAWEQMDYAVENGVNFFDTAEMYPVPSKEVSYGTTEKFIGNWMKARKNRKDIIIASKVTGPLPYFQFVTKGRPFNRERINEAIDNSLTRLQTDYVDLYQLHFPERKTNYFSVRGYSVHDNEWQDNFGDAVLALGEAIKSGKIRHWGVSNETPWGVMRCKEESKLNEVEQIVSIQNPYNLLNRSFETGLSEIAVREEIGLLAYSPLGFGLLSGKYHKKIDTPDDRINKFKNLARYNSVNSHKATAEYLKLAEDNGMTLAQMALAFINQMPFVTANIIGATSMDQLKENIGSIDLKLNGEIIKSINDVHNLIPDPAP
jgi:aryl-alcohol dehydrogenase-like predicted oxidoreductase